MSPLTVAERIGIIRSSLAPFPGEATGPHRDCFDRLLERHGDATVYAYLRRRNVINATLVSHAGHPAVAAEDGPFQLYRTAALAIRELHRTELASVAAEFRAQDVPLLVYKGLALDALIDNTEAPSFSNDIDLLVRKASLADARKIIEALGYEAGIRIDNGRVRRMPARISRMTEESIYSYGQVQPYHRLVPVPALEGVADRVRALMPRTFCTLSGQLHVRISIDLHYSLNLLTEDIGTRVKPSEDSWWEGTQELRVGDAAIRTLSDDVLGWALLHRLYVDCTVLQETGLKSLCHIKLLWHRGRFDLDGIHEAARRHPYLAPSVHQALRAVDSICDLGLQGLVHPREFRTAAAPLMNVGDCLPALLDFGVSFDLTELEQGGAGARFY
ncbi:nucleotidyltransferase family protein [Streptomyces sp. NBC_00525]|uniref:nucleotidyltransferase family protein n=1 Tax=Streptomyces sp. NBC_00525 TaxID=2903660 RepID=UPI002E81D4DC|nr:nucleotidyltransferase family protein [Streptomyces sp. NBC_00525]WUC96726.1 nucleotidyltransferase family protein [Streptomyces sp. NBC_00525]